MKKDDGQNQSGCEGEGEKRNRNYNEQGKAGARKLQIDWMFLGNSITLGVSNQENVNSDNPNTDEDPRNGKCKMKVPRSRAPMIRK